MDKSFRKLDEMTVSAEFRARKIYESFMQRMVGIRANVEQELMNIPEAQDANTISAGPDIQENGEEIYG
jgi:hypothetical protein